MSYRTSAEIDKVAESLSAAQAQLRGASKDAKNPHFGQKYATLESVWDACRDALTANGLSVVQPVASEDGAAVTISTVLLHKSGQWIASDLALKPVKTDPQGIGSAITYGRRYGLASMVGVSPSDDDGNEASGHEPKTEPRKTPKPVSKPSETVKPQLAAIWEMMTGPAECLEEIKSWRGIVGAEAFQATLKKYGVTALDKPADIKSLNTARAIVADLFAMPEVAA